MAVRNIIKIDEDKCNGCGQCVVDCAEAAIRIVDGKAKLIKELYCDGLGACMGGCPTGALSIEQREADDFDEEATNRHVDETKKKESGEVCGCPGTGTVDFTEKKESDYGAADSGPELANWPIQLKLAAVNAPFLNNADLLLAADCAAFSTVNFQSRFIRGRKLLIACPKLDDAQYYHDKLTDIFRENSIRSITVVRMEVPCCGGLRHIVTQALEASGKDIHFNEVIIGIKGDILSKGKTPVIPRFQKV